MKNSRSQKLSNHGSNRPASGGGSAAGRDVCGTGSISVRRFLVLSLLGLVSSRSFPFLFKYTFL